MTDRFMFEGILLLLMLISLITLLVNATIEKAKKSEKSNKLLKVVCLWVANISVALFWLINLDQVTGKGIVQKIYLAVVLILWITMLICKFGLKNNKAVTTISTLIPILTILSLAIVNVM